MQYHLRTLGRFSLHPRAPDADPVLSESKSLAVLAYAAAAPGREVQRSHLASLLWPDSDRKSARRSLRQAIYYLSQRADDGLLLSDEGVVCPNEQRLQVDLWAFERALEEGDWGRAVELYDGDFLNGYQVDGAREFAGWRESQNERIWSGLKAACYRLVEEAVEEGEYERAISYGEKYADLNPLDESAQRTLIRAHLAAGDRVSAYQAYEQYRALLEEELGAEPDTELEERIGALRDELFQAPMARAPDPSEVDLLARTSNVTVTPVDGPDAADAEDAGETASAPGEEAPTDGRSGLAGRPWVGAAAALLAGVLLGVGVSGWIDAGPAGDGRDQAPAAGTTGPWTGATGVLRVRTEGGGWTRLSVQDGRVRERSAVDRAPVRWNPDGTRGLVVRHAADGADVAVVSRSGDTVRVIGTAADERPIAWAPDGRRVLFSRGDHRAEGRELARRLGVADLRSGAEHALDTLDVGPAAEADWSPRGPRIVFGARPEDGDPGLFLAHADLRRVRKVATGPGAPAEPAWAPGARRIAYSGGSGSARDLHVMAADGSGREQVTFGETEDHDPVWLSPHHLAFLSNRGGSSDVWLLDLRTRAVRALTRDGGARRLELSSRSETGPHLARIRLDPAQSELCPGQHRRLRVSARGSAGGRIAAASLPLRWSVTDPSIVRWEEPGTLRVTGTGTTRAIVSAGGWVADTLRLRSSALATRSVPGPLMTEAWSGGIRRDRWILFGRPAPQVVDAARTAGPPTSEAGPGSPPSDAPDRVFLNNGDRNYNSGVVSRDVFASGDGLTLEVEASLPFTASVWQTLQLGLVPRAPEPGAFRFVGRGRGLTLTLGGEDPSRATVSWGEGRTTFPLPERDLESWHRVRLQLEPGGRASLVVDDTMRWRSVGPVAEGLVRDSLHVYLGGRSDRTRIRAGRVRLWSGVRYGPSGPDHRVTSAAP